MASNEGQLEVQTEHRESPELLPQEKKLYSSMDFETLVKAIENIDISVLDRARLINPKKQRSCFKREPVSEEHRKKEKNKIWREYTKKNRDEVAGCRALFEELNEVRGRLEDLLKEYNVEIVGMRVTKIVAGFETILRKYLAVNLHELGSFVSVYHGKAVQVMQYEHRPISDNFYATKLVELKQQFDTLTSEKDTLSSSKDKVNYASAKSRLNKKIIREQLKSDCWECWNDIKTLVLRGQELKKLLNQLKKQVWDNVLAAYFRLFHLFNQQHKSQFDVQQIQEMVEYFTPFSCSPGRLLIKWTSLEEPKLPALPPIAETKQSAEPRLERPQKIDFSAIFGLSPLSLPSFAPSTAPASSVPFQKSPCFQTQNSSTPSSSIALEKPTPEVADTLIKPKLTALPSLAETKQTGKPRLEKPQKIEFSAIFGPSPLSSPSFAPPTAPASSVPFQKSPCFQTQNSSISSSSNALDMTVKVKRTDTSDGKESETLVNWRRCAFSSFDDGSKNMRNPIEDLQKTLVENTLPVPAQPIGGQQISPIPFNAAALGTIPFAYSPLAPSGEMSPVQAALTPDFLRAMEQQRVMAAFLNHAFQGCQK